MFHLFLNDKCDYTIFEDLDQVFLVTLQTNL